MEVFPLFSTPLSVRKYDNRISSEDLANIKSEEYHEYPKQLDGSCTVDEQMRADVNDFVIFRRWRTVCRFHSG